MPLKAEGIKNYRESGDEKLYKEIKTQVLNAKTKQEAKTNLHLIRQELQDIHDLKSVEQSLLLMPAGALVKYLFFWLLQTTVPPLVTTLMSALPTISVSIGFFRAPVLKATLNGRLNKLVELEDIAEMRVNALEENRMRQDLIAEDTFFRPKVATI